MKTRVISFFENGKLFYQLQYLNRIQNDIEIWINVCSYPACLEYAAIEKAMEMSKIKNND